jgi:alpha-beta hydrolase superfamily lysophospholipase
MNSLLIILAVIFFILIVLRVLLRQVLHKAFHHDPIKASRVPSDAGLKAEEMFIETEGGKKIQLYRLGDVSKGPVIIATHGWANTVEKLFSLAGKLREAGYPVILMNGRNHGESDSDEYTTMVKFSADFRSTIRFVHSQAQGNQQIILLGHSLGAATSLYVTSNDPHIAGVVAVASFADLEKTMTDSFLRYHFKPWMIRAVLRYVERAVGERLVNLAPRNTIKRITQPTLLFHGDRDRIVPVAAMDELKANSGSAQIETIRFPGCDHSSLLENSELHEQAVSFLQKYFPLNKVELG